MQLIRKVINEDFPYNCLHTHKNSTTSSFCFVSENEKTVGTSFFKIIQYDVGCLEVAWVYWKTRIGGRGSRTGDREIADRSLPRRHFKGNSYFVPPHLHKRLLNWEQHSFPIVFLFLEPSEAMRARGIIVLVKSNHNVIAQKYRDKTTLASKTRFSRHCFVFQSRRYSLLVGYNIQPSISSTNQTQHG